MPSPDRPGTPPGRTLALLTLLLATGLPGAFPGALRAQDEPAPEPISRSPITERSGDIEPLGPSLFPFYDHYLRRSDQTEVLNVLYLYRSVTRPEGDHSTFLLPFYYHQHQEVPRDHRLHLFPLLYFSRDAEDVRYNLSPIFSYYGTSESEHRLLFPFWYNRHDRVEQTSEHHLLFPLSSWQYPVSEEGSGESTFRLGLWRTLELAQGAFTPEESRVNVLSVFDLYGDARTPLALFRHRSTPEATHTHFFPLYWSGGTERSAYTMLFPLYGHSRLGTQSDHWFPLFLSRFGSRDEHHSRQDILFPLISSRQTPETFHLRFSPLFEIDRNPERHSWGLLNLILGNVLYQNDHDLESGKTAHSFLAPLGRIDIEPDAPEGHVRFLPFYWDSFDADSRFIYGTTFLNWQERSGDKMEWEFLYGMPTYFHWGSPESYFGFGFPLYWESYRRPHGWKFLFPLYFSFSTRASHGIHLLPLFSYNNYPSEVQLALLGPLFIQQLFYDHEGNNEGFATSLAWPFFQVRHRTRGYHYRLLPLGWVGKQDEERDFLLFPLWYRQWGGDRSQNYFFPIYGRYDSPRLKREFYGLGTYFHTEELDSDGEVFRRSRDFLWPLVSFQDNEKTGESHQRILPLGYWNTESPPVDRRVAGPFYYGHRVDSEDRRRELDLFLGNLYFSHEVKRPREPRRALSPLAAEGRTAELAEAGEVARPEPRPAEEFETVSTERGILWPLTRWASEEGGKSSSWVLPFYFRSKSPEASTLGLFPFFFNDEMQDRYQPSYFRYFYLFDREVWPGGARYSVLQLLFDWKADDRRESYRWRFLYPLVENSWDPETFAYQFTPLIQGQVSEAAGVRESSHFLFPLLWLGSRKKLDENQQYAVESEHFMLFPLYGYSEKELRTTHDFLLPFFHAVDGANSFKFQMRPLIYYRHDPEEHSFRFWPFHSFEKGETAGDWWVSRYLFLSRASLRKESWEVRLDPFLFRASSSPDSSGFATLFELWAYDREGAETDLRMLPFLYGYSHRDEAGLDLFPLYHSRNHGDDAIHFFNPLRALYLTSHLRGNHYEYTSVLTLLAEYESNDRRPQYSDFRFLFRLIQRTKTETSSTYAFYPFFSYHRDDAELRKQIFCLFPGYRYEERAGKGTHYLFWFFPVAGD